MPDPQQLRDHILSLSVASDFDTARGEWKLFGVELRDDWDNCPCGQDIKELCYIRNERNGNETYVGNVCINKFIGISTGNLFVGLRRLVKYPSANANEDVIFHAHNLGYIFENEYAFLMNTRFKRSLSPKQRAWKVKINQRILKKTVVR